jgi:hypothetical protein
MFDAPKVSRLFAAFVPIPARVIVQVVVIGLEADVSAVPVNVENAPKLIRLELTAMRHIANVIFARSEVFLIARIDFLIWVLFQWDRFLF